MRHAVFVTTTKQTRRWCIFKKRPVCSPILEKAPLLRVRQTLLFPECDTDLCPIALLPSDAVDDKRGCDLFVSGNFSFLGVHSGRCVSPSTFFAIIFSFKSCKVLYACLLSRHKKWSYRKLLKKKNLTFKLPHRINQVNFHYFSSYFYLFSF